MWQAELQQAFFGGRIVGLPPAYYQLLSARIPSYTWQCTHVHMAVYARTLASVRMYTAMCTTASARIAIGESAKKDWDYSNGKKNNFRNFAIV